MKFLRLGEKFDWLFLNVGDLLKKAGRVALFLLIVELFISLIALLFFPSVEFAKVFAVVTFLSVTSIAIMLMNRLILGKMWHHRIAGQVVDSGSFHFITSIKNSELIVQRANVYFLILLACASTQAVIFLLFAFIDPWYILPLLLGLLVIAGGLLCVWLGIYFWHSGNYTNIKKQTEVNLKKIRGSALSKKMPVYFYVTGNPASDYQVEMWRPLLEQENEQIILLVRDSRGVNLVSTFPNKAYYVPGNKAANEFFSHGESTILYPGHYDGAINLFRFQNVNHVFIGHGDSEKATSVRRYLRLYDYHFVAGQAAVDRFKSAGLEDIAARCLKVGAPYIVDNEPKFDELIPARKGKQDTRPICSIVTTWGGFNKLERDTTIEYLEALLLTNVDVFSKYRFVLSPHPMTERVAEDKASLKSLTTLIKKHGGTVSTDSHNAVIKSDIVMMDLSAMNSVVVYKKIPFVMLMPRRLISKDDSNINDGLKRFHDLSVYAAKSANIHPYINNLTDLLDESRLSPKRRKSLNQLAKYHYSVDNNPESVRIFMSELLNLASCKG